MKPSKESLRLLFLAASLSFLVAGCSLPKRKPLYVSDNFVPANVGTITVLQPVDLRYDRSLKTDFVSILGKQTNRLLKKRKYKVELNEDLSLVSGISEQDLDNPSPAWIQNLGPQGADWVLLPTIEYVTRFSAGDSEAIAEVGAVLFEKGSGHVAWKGLGKGHMHVGIMFAGLADNDAVRMAASDLFFSLPRKNDDLAEYMSLPDPGVPLEYDKEALPRIGMTKEDVVGLFGETKKIESNDRGETWYYHLNLGEAFIPFAANFYYPKVWVFDFDNQGLLAKYHFTDSRISGRK